MKKIILLAIFLPLVMSVRAQLFVDTNYTPQQMINAFFNQNGVAVSNITYSGQPTSMGFFEGSQSNIGLNAGLLFATGNAMSAVGPNISGGTTTSFNQPGSPWLDALIPGYMTYDAGIIEMDIIPSGDTLSFSYVFASEEYKEYVNTSFNDVFAFLIDGPGLPTSDSIYVPADTIINYVDSGFTYVCIDSIYTIYETICYSDSTPNGGGLVDTCIVYEYPQTQYCYYAPGNPGFDTIIYPGYWYLSPGGYNMAFVPNTNLPVAINNVNQNLNSQYFISNEPGNSVEYDGFTTPLWANLAVTPGATYHVRLAVADAGDHVLDSGVFLSIESLNGDSLLPTVPQFSAYLQSGQTEVTFENNTLWATKWHWDFGDGTTSDEKYPSAHKYQFAGQNGAEGIFTVKLTASNWCSTKTIEQMLDLTTIATHETSADEMFQIFPNPARGPITFDLKNNPSAQMRLFAADGRLLLENQVKNGQSLDLNQFGKGFYNLQLTFDGQTFNRKVVNN